MKKLTTLAGSGQTQPEISLFDNSAPMMSSLQMVGDWTFPVKNTGRCNTSTYSLRF
ncbi:MAG: hypothetical protein ACRC4K_06695 [Plesiomonas shigelloides]